MFCSNSGELSARHSLTGFNKYKHSSGAQQSGNHFAIVLHLLHFGSFESRHDFLSIDASRKSAHI